MDTISDPLLKSSIVGFAVEIMSPIGDFAFFEVSPAMSAAFFRVDAFYEGDEFEICAVGEMDEFVHCETICVGAAVDDEKRVFEGVCDGLEGSVRDQDCKVV
ncbi:hypothetical protein HG531_011234 [Fusarium graminearum]|nr:hypothetical protein HG531_011234 [Fusarium graminearum]